MRHASLFSGIGGFDLAAEWAGWENVLHCEINPFCRKVLNHYWPEAISYHDIKSTDFTIHRGSVNVLTGGFPCQPYSTAGKRLGKEDERHLWPEMLRAIREIRPGWVVGENVRGLTNWNGGLVFDEVQADLEAQGYEVLPFLLPACGANAPHRRDRIWFVAHRVAEFREENRGIGNEGQEQAGKTDRENRPSDTNPNSQRELQQEGLIGIERGRPLHGDSQIASDAQSPERPELPIGTIAKHTGAGIVSINGNAPDAEFSRLERRGREWGGFKQERKANSWEGFPTQPPLCGGDDGIPRKLDGITFPKWRNESIKAYGNAVVPQIPHQIFQAINAYETTQETPETTAPDRKG